MKISSCKVCSKEIKRNGNKPGIFCSKKCKGEWQKTQKPVTEEWLKQKYLVEGLGCYEIAKLVDRNPKNVYNWLLGYNIKTREQKKSVIEFNKRKSTKEKRSKFSKGRKLSEEAKLKISLAILDSK